MYTSHGHHIPGTDTANPPKSRARCGGPTFCDTCARDVALARLSDPLGPVCEVCAADLSEDESILSLASASGVLSCESCGNFNV